MIFFFDIFENAPIVRAGLKALHHVLNDADVTGAELKPLLEPPQLLLFHHTPHRSTHLQLNTITANTNLLNTHTHGLLRIIQISVHD